MASIDALRRAERSTGKRRWKEYMPMEGRNVSARCCSGWGLRDRHRARIVLAYEQLFLSLNFAPTNVSALQQMQKLDFVLMLKFSVLKPILQTALSHSNEAEEIQIKISTGINSFDSENPDVNIIFLHQNLHSSSKKCHKFSSTSFEYQAH